ncbi:DUF6429 family protein [Enterococcus rivorum]
MLLLLYLNSWEEKTSLYTSTRSWKSYDFNRLNQLTDEGLITNSKRSKSFCFTNDGIEKAKKLIDKYQIELNK